jgi:hypothetical protein
MANAGIDYGMGLSNIDKETGIRFGGAPTHPQGVSLWGEMNAYEATQYRYRNHHRRIRWSDLPEHIQAHVLARAEEE